MKQPESSDPIVLAAWHEHRGHLLDVAYRMLGSVSDAEDVVQDAFARLLRADTGSIDDVRAWLVVVTSRLCLDQLRSARVRREAYVGPWLPEPVIAVDEQLLPEERITLDESVRMALLLVLERLSPAERVAFILHDVFEYSFDDISRVMGKTSAACRQLASRARRHVNQEGAGLRGVIDPVEARRVADRFIAAATTGDLHGLLELLDPEAAGWTDSGGLVAAPRDRLVGRQRVAERFLWWLRTFEITLEPMPVNAAAGALAMQHGDLMAVLVFEIDSGRVATIHSVANPEKLRHVKAALDRAAAQSDGAASSLAH
ncbi:MAG: RNA polymerase sigma factor SigJ [Candidatus Dormibacteraeota bacterium]|nr:RNA polymerase sigma factor SigJ [Candidatus Dormibacteraeota bacterium]